MAARPRWKIRIPKYICTTRAAQLTVEYPPTPTGSVHTAFLDYMIPRISGQLYTIVWLQLVSLSADAPYPTTRMY